MAARRKSAVEKYFEHCPELRSDEKLLLDFICSEYSLRQEQGESPLLSEYTARFPRLASQLEVLFEVLQAIEDKASVHAFDQPTTNYVQSLGSPHAGADDTVSTIVQKNSAAAVASADNRVPRTSVPMNSLKKSRGGMGAVYRARQPKLNRVVAIKMILPNQFDSESAARRFQIEAEAAAKLDHPGVVPIYDVGEHDGQHYLCMAYIDGESLAARVTRGCVPPDEAARIVRDVAEAIQHAHDRGIIHRDLKPANILIDSAGRPRMTDFGLARKNDAVGALTIDGNIIGTPSYMSPEQASGRTAIVGPACDIYSLGTVLFHLLTGHPPFGGSNVLEIIRQVCEEAPKTAPRSQCVDPRSTGINLPHMSGERPAEPLRHRRCAGQRLESLPPGRGTRRIRCRASRWQKWLRKPVAVGIIAGIILLLFGAIFWISALGNRSKGLPGANRGEPISDVPAAKSIAGDPMPLSGDLTIRIWDPQQNSRRHGLTFDSPGALPLRYGDQIRIEAENKSSGVSLPHLDHHRWRGHPGVSLEAEDTVEARILETSAGHRSAD